MFKMFLGLIYGMFMLGVALAQNQSFWCPQWQTDRPKEIDITGQIVELSFPVATLETEDGQQYLVRLGPWWFWARQGYNLQKGEWVEIRGFLKGRLLFPRVIHTSKQTIRLRDKVGFPLWRGSWGRGLGRGGLGLGGHGWGGRPPLHRGRR